MKHLWGVVCLVAWVTWAQAAGVEPAAKEVRIPEKKWLDEAKGYQEALELQKLTGADLVVYFAQYSPPDKRGLSTWFERKGLQQGPVVDALKPYIKVKVTLPLDKKELPLFEKFRVNSGPVLFVVQTNGWRYRVAPFDWPGGEPEVRTAAALVEEIRSKSSARYRPEGQSAPPAPEAP